MLMDGCLPMCRNSSDYHGCCDGEWTITVSAICTSLRSTCMHAHACPRHLQAPASVEAIWTRSSHASLIGHISQHSRESSTLCVCLVLPGDTATATGVYIMRKRLMLSVPWVVFQLCI